MNIKISTDGNTVTLWHGEQMAWDAWLSATERSVQALRRALGCKTYSDMDISTYRAAVDGKRFLNACGVNDQNDFEELEKRLPLLRKPATPANATRCRRCLSRIWGKEALATGLGSQCRRGGASHAARVKRIAES